MDRKQSRLGADAVKIALDLLMDQAAIGFEYIDKVTGMTQLERLKVARKACGEKTRVSAEELQKMRVQLLEKADKSSPMYQRILQGTGRAFEIMKGEDNLVDINDMNVTYVVFQKGNLQEKMKTAFACADFQEHGFLTREELKKFLEYFFQATYSMIKDTAENPKMYNITQDLTSLKQNLPNIKHVLRLEKIDGMVTSAFDHADTNKDNKLSFEEWENWTAKGDFKDTWGAVADLIVC